MKQNKAKQVDEKTESKLSVLFASLIIFLKGILMGSADIVPGVSGGTIALVSGIYTRLIDGIHGVYSLFSWKTIQLIFQFKWKQVWKKITKVDFAFFVPLFAGIVIAFLTLAHLISYLMESHVVPTYAFFFGLILASALFLFKQIDAFSKKRGFALLVGVILGFIITGLQTVQANHSLPIIFVSGAIAITAMILPGISGSFMLVMLNQYEYVIHAIKSLDISIIIVFGFGAFLGLMAFSKVLTYMLHSHKNGTFAFLVGLMLGSLRMQYGIIKTAGITTQNIISLLIAGSIGFLVVLVLEHVSKKLHKK